MIRLGEKPFRSVQGEVPCGKLSIWVRFFGCTLDCPGFSQSDPIDPTTYVLPHLDDAKKYKTLAELPVFKTGCDSSYSVSAKFKHLALTYENVQELYEKDIVPLLYNGEWIHPVTHNEVDICFTGGEPMLWQDDIVDLYDLIRANKPKRPVLDIQIETNGTVAIKPKFHEWFRHGNFLLRWNISPKLFHVSGEPPDRAWKPEIILAYNRLSSHGCLKFVMNNDERAWQELNYKVKTLMDMGCDLPVYIMPVGSTKEQQEDSKVISKIADRAIKEGYHISGRMHSVIWGNTIGV